VRFLDAKTQNFALSCYSISDFAVDEAFMLACCRSKMENNEQPASN